VPPPKNSEFLEFIRIIFEFLKIYINPLNRTCHLLALLGAHHILHVSRIKRTAILITENKVLVLSYSKTNQMHLFLKLFILAKHSTGFGRSFRSSSEVQDSTYSNRHTRRDPKISGIVTKIYLKYSYKFETLVPFKVLPL
jgi:hypothetical protein